MAEQARGRWRKNQREQGKKKKEVTARESRGELGQQGAWGNLKKEGFGAEEK